ncbi:MAG TPA: hypothetical protein VI758_10100 [Bacteroidota bacterium]
MENPRYQNFLRIQRASTVVLALVLGTGCATVSTNLQSVSVSGPLHQPGVHLQRTTDSLGLRVSPWLAIYGQSQREGRISGHTPVNAAGVYQVDTVTSANGTQYYENASNIYTYSGKNFTWQIPKISGGVGFDIDLTRSFSAIFGMGVSSVNNEANWSALAGIGFNFGNERFAGRLEGAFTWETIGSSAQFVRRIDYFYSNRTEVQFFTENNRRMRSGNYGALTLQSTGKTLTFYTQFAFGSQNIASLAPQNNTGSSDADFVRSMKFVTVTPGIAFTIADNTRIVTGIRFLSNTEIDETDSPFLVAPLVQLEMSF